MIYLDNAATTLVKPESVYEAVLHAMRTEANAARATHPAALESSSSILAARKSISNFFGADGPKRVAFTVNATEALNTAILGVCQRGDRIVSTHAEHNSVLRPLYRMVRERGIDLSFIPVDPLGRLDENQARRLIVPGTKAVILSHASNLTGNTVDLSFYADLAHRCSALLIVDASQSAGSIPIDMKSMGIDILCYTGHKALFGPQGTGGIILREGLEIAPLKTGGTGIDSYNPEQPQGMPAHLEAGTLNAHGIAGLKAGIDFIESVTLPVIERKERALQERFLSQIKRIKGIRILGDPSLSKRAPIVSVNVRDIPSPLLSNALSYRYGIATRSGIHCAPLLHRALGTSQQGAVRFSFSYFSTEEEADQAAFALQELSCDL